ncbi:alanine racemase [Candidatus Magnetomonas plexicatena]|uniref:alanine racemase n=1 Tax=Candidatus Magnetomonas plexicatena TaxID=2552947 RepID=UPI001103AB3F|nr:alanine racemase [Nitrospirales bacterium LBB_01]
MRGPVVEIDLTALVHNYGVLVERCQGRPVIAVVKADAYGHGAVAVALALEAAGVHSFGAAFLSEAVELRQAGVKKPILILFDSPKPEEIVRYSLIPIARNETDCQALSDYALSNNTRIKIHVNIDTGMGRLGFAYDECVDKLINLTDYKGIEVTGFMSHFSEADLHSRAFAEHQLDRFLEIRKIVSPYYKSALWHFANSAAVLSYPASHLDAVRPGLMLYGANPMACKSDINCDDFLKPVMTVKSRLIDIRKVSKGKSISYGRTFTTQRNSLIGVLSVGYADGYPRSLSNIGRVIVNGRYAPIVGRVCMDLTMVDLTDISDINETDEVTLIGSDGNCKITPCDLAALSGTIPYEIVTALGRNKNKKYLNNFA